MMAIIQSHHVRQTTTWLPRDLAVHRCGMLLVLSLFNTDNILPVLGRYLFLDNAAGQLSLTLASHQLGSHAHKACKARAREEAH